MEFLEVVHVVTTGILAGSPEQKTVLFSSEQTSIQHLLKINFVVSYVLNLELEG